MPQPMSRASPRLEILPFEESHVGDAGRLLAERHRRHRLAEPLLSARYEADRDAEAEVAAAFRAPGASGAVAARGGRVVGYLLGAPKAGSTWGPNAWVESAGQAVERAEDVRDLYAAAASRWVEEGRTAHYVVVPASDGDLVNAWFRLAFGHQHTHAVRPITRSAESAPAGTGPTAGDDGERDGAAAVRVRRAVRADIPTLARLEIALPAHQALAPTFSAGPAGSYEESVREWEEDFDDPDFASFVAEYDGRVVGSAVGCPLERSGSNTALIRPDNAGFLGFAAVFPQWRGLGAGRALGQAVLSWSADQGHSCTATDWRATNLLSSRAWPALGFRSTFLRLHRLLGH